MSNCPYYHCSAFNRLCHQCSNYLPEGRKKPEFDREAKIKRLVLAAREELAQATPINPEAQLALNALAEALKEWADEYQDI